ncbi:MAG: hypothetical protein C4530_15610 [Desulfobacteraceae bacterium]|nr:MAG: hypothetical protein C4530_15610 [Desulfobacteraceae bacterium]
MLFLVDSMRPDGLLQADTPCMDRMIAEGAHTFCAKTVVPSMTLPCHTSLFFGVDPEVHGITTNTWEGTKKPMRTTGEAAGLTERTSPRIRQFPSS